MNMKTKRRIAIILIILAGIMGWGVTELGTKPENVNQVRKENHVKQGVQKNNKQVQSKEGVKAKEIQQKIQKIVDRLTIEEKIAQMFFVTPEALIGQSTMTALQQELDNAVQDYPVGGFIMMENNIVSPEQITDFNGALKELSRKRIGMLPFLGVDEEGGEVARIADNENFQTNNVGNMSDIGSSGDISNAYNAGAYIGAYLKTYGFNVDFAPDADVWINADNSVVKYRAFSSDAGQTAAMVEQAVQGFHSQGICTALKHFPGHGATGQDSHEGAAYSQRSLEQLRQCEFLPFESGIRSGTEFVMVGHIALPEVTGNDIPAALSGQIIAQLLRKELGYKGIVITDAMNMGAIANYYSAADAAVQSIEAGADMILMPSDFKAAYQGVLDAVQKGKISEERIDESLRRIIVLKINLDD